MKYFDSIFHAVEGVKGGELSDQQAVLIASASHHQKVVVVDYIDPFNAVGFVMGHNMQKNYRDSDQHYYATKIRSEGFMPWQDISFRVRGPVLFDLNHNFVKAWARDATISAKYADSKKQHDDYMANLSPEERAAITSKIKELQDRGIIAAGDWLSSETDWNRVGEELSRQGTLIGEDIIVGFKKLGAAIWSPWKTIKGAATGALDSTTAAGRSVGNTYSLNRDLAMEPERDQLKPQDFKIYVSQNNTNNSLYVVSDKHREEKKKSSMPGIDTVAPRAQIWRTQPPEGDFTVLAGYKNAFRRAKNLIYTENQYFRHEELAQIVVTNAAKRWESKGEGTEPIYWFVVTNTPVSKFEVDNTYDTLKVVGHETQLAEYERVMKYYHDNQKFSNHATIGKLPESERLPKMSEELKKEREALLQAQDQAQLEAFDKKYPRPKTEIDTDKAREAIEYTDKTGLKVVMACLMTSSNDSVNKNLYSSVYVHSKLTVVDDGVCILGSANLNIRSMKADSELCIAVVDNIFPRNIREELWKHHTGKVVTELNQNYKDWNDLMDDNWENMHEGKRLNKHLVHFYDAKTPPGIRVD